VAPVTIDRVLSDDESHPNHYVSDILGVWESEETLISELEISTLKGPTKSKPTVDEKGRIRAKSPEHESRTRVRHVDIERLVDP